MCAEIPFEGILMDFGGHSFFPLLDTLALCGLCLLLLVVFGIKT